MLYYELLGIPILEQKPDIAILPLRDGVMLGLWARDTVERPHQRRWVKREDARRDLFAYIEGYYNRRRIHFAVGYKTPEQAERHMA